MENCVKMYVRLLDEGSIEVFRPIPAIQLAKNQYRLLGHEQYDPETETWEFLPDTIVKGEFIKSHKGGEFLAAVPLDKP